MLKSNILFSARQKGLRSNAVSSVRKICLRFDGARRKSDPYHLAYFLLTSIEKNYRKRNEIPTDGYTFLLEITHSFQIVFDGFFNPIADKYLSIIEDKIQHEKVDF